MATTPALSIERFKTGIDTKRRIRVRDLIATAVLLLLTPHAVPAKLMMATLKELVESSEVVVTGHFPSAPTHRHLTVLTFRLTSVVKAGANPELPAEIAFCDPDTDVEYPDLNDVDGDLILFLRKIGRCYSLTWGRRPPALSSGSV